ncbi:MAG: hypothetical protein RLN62_02640 [Rickettsiales bacterium]
MKNYKIISALLVALIFGFSGGKYYESRDKNSIYIFDQERFIKLVAMGVALENPDPKRVMADPDNKAKESLGQKMKKLKLVINDDYKNHPMLITPLSKNRIPKGYYGIYGNSKRVDITEDLIIKVIGEKRWKEIGTTFLR